MKQYQLFANNKVDNEVDIPDQGDLMRSYSVTITTLQTPRWLLPSEGRRGNLPSRQQSKHKATC